MTKIQSTSYGTWTTELDLGIDVNTVSTRALTLEDFRGVEQMYKTYLSLSAVFSKIDQLAESSDEDDSSGESV